MGNATSTRRVWTPRMRSEPAMDPLVENILKTLNKLDELEFVMFKFHLRRSDILGDLNPIPKRPLKRTGKRTLAHLMVQRYSYNDAHQIMVKVLENIYRNDLVERFPHIYEDSSEQHEATAAEPPTSTSTSDTTVLTPVQREATATETPDQHEVTVTEIPAATSTRRALSETEVTNFVDEHRRVLIQRVTNVKSILDVLLEARAINQESYNNVMSKNTDQDKMRELYTLLTSRKRKYFFYRALEEYEDCLLHELCPQPSPTSEPKGSSASSQAVLVKTRTGDHPITYYQDMLRSQVEEPFSCLPKEEVPREDKEDFKESYTRLTVTHIDETNSSEPVVTPTERKKAGQDVQLSEIYKHPSRPNEPIRTVMSTGDAGVGKTFLVHKFLTDWAKKKDQDPHLIFVLPFRQLNVLKQRKFSLAQLIHKCIHATKCIPEEALDYIFNKMQKSGITNYDRSPFKVMFVLEGYDECHLNLDFESHHDCSDDLTKAVPLEVLLVNLIKGTLLPPAHLWITTRPAAAKQIPDGLVDLMTEVRGFTDDAMVKYIQKRCRDEKQADRISSHIKASKNLHIMCETPVYCWIIVSVLKDMLRTNEKGKLPKTLAGIYCRFLFVQIKRKWLRHGGKHQKLTEADKAVLLKLGRLAFEHLQKGNIIFYQKDLERCQINIKEGPVDSGLCTEIFRPDSKFFQETIYCFVHLSIQEFLSAAYLFECFTKRDMKVLKAFLEDDDFNHDSSLSDFLKAAMKKALKSKSGHLDLFVRFLHGLALEDNHRLLGGLLDQTENSPEEIQRAISNLKEMDPCCGSPDRCINIFQCLMELKALSVSQGIQQYLESGKILDGTQYSALVRMLQISDEVLGVLEMQKYNTSNKVRQRLVPAVRNCTTARLVDCDLEENHIGVVASALASNPSHLRELDLSGNVLKDSGLDLICTALKSPNCCLEILRLKNCSLPERCCEVLASALISNPSLHLRELDVSLNMVNESGMKMLLSAGREDLTVKHGGEDRFNAPLIKGYFQSLTLDTNTTHCGLTMSEDNKKVTRVRGQRHPYPDDRERFDGWEQFLCTDSVSEHWYSEVEYSGTVHIAGTDRRISRKGDDHDCRLGYNIMSWSLECYGYSYSVRHNSEVTTLPVSPSRCSNGVYSVYRVAVYVDRPAGTLSFYDVSSEDTLVHLHTFQITSTEPICVGFSLYPGSSVFL